MLKCFIFSLVLGLVATVSSVSAQDRIVPDDRGTIIVDSSSVYWLTSSGEFCSPLGSVKQRNKAGFGPITPLYEDCFFSPLAVGQDATQLYVHDTDADVIARLPKAGGTPMPIAEAPAIGNDGVHGVFVEGGVVFWGDLEGIKRTSVAGFGVTTLVPAPPSPRRIARDLVLDATYIYFVETNSGNDTASIKRVPREGGAVDTLHTELVINVFAPTIAAVSGDEIFLVQHQTPENDSPKIVRAMPKDGGTPATVINRGAGREVSSAILKNNFLFFVDTDNAVLPCADYDSSIHAYNVVTGQIEELVDGLHRPGALTTDANFLYYADCGAEGGIFRLPIPGSLIDADGDGVPAATDCDDQNPDVSTGNTCVSSGPVTVTSPGGEVSVTFQEVTAGGETTITVSPCTRPIEGITLTPTAPICVEIETTAEYVGEIMVCIQYDDAGMTIAEETFLRMVHCHGGDPCTFAVCTPPVPVDTVNNVVCGCVPNFSLFAVGFPLDTDLDGTPDLLDNCPTTPNIFQEDADEDGIGDVCDPCPTNPSPDCSLETQFRRGDCNTDGVIEISDAAFLFSELFVAGADATCDDACDANDDGLKDVADGVYLLNHLFGGGPDPVTPFDACGLDASADGLGCETYGVCP